MDYRYLMLIPLFFMIMSCVLIYLFFLHYVYKVLEDCLLPEYMKKSRKKKLSDKILEKIFKMFNDGI